MANQSLKYPRVWTILGLVWCLVLVGLALTMFFPVLGREYQRENGETCNENLELIFRAKQELAHDLNLDPALPYPPIVQTLKPQDLAPYLKKYGRDLRCPSGGDYEIRPLVDEHGEVVPPVCNAQKLDSDGNGVSLAGEGLHVHLRSHLQDVDTGRFFPDPWFTFPNALGRASK
jgi:hypothetical protein